MYLEEIIEGIEIKNDKFEAKAVLNREDVVGWLKTIVISRDIYSKLICNDRCQEVNWVTTNFLVVCF